MLQGFIVAELGGIKSTDSRLDVADIESFHAFSETVLLCISAKKCGNNIHRVPERWEGFVALRESMFC